MPGSTIDERRIDLSAVYARYRREYVAKGCSTRKADDLASKKVQRQRRKGKI